MTKKKENKKTSTLKKLFISLIVIVALLFTAITIYWFSMPIEARNLVSFMALSKKDYSNYKKYQVIQRNKDDLQPTGVDIKAAESKAKKMPNKIYIEAVTEMIKNNTSAMLKKGMMKTIGVKSYTGWQILADEGANKGTYPYGPSPLSYYTGGEAANLHTQIIKVAKHENVILDKITVEVRNDFYWDNMMTDAGTGHLGFSDVSIVIESNASSEVIQKIKKEAIDAWTVGQALRNKVKITPHLVINGDNWKNYYAKPGTSKSDKSYDGDFELSSVTKKPKKPKYSKPTKKKFQMSLFNIEAMSNIKFQIYAISESAGNSNRPYLKKITISSPTEETWRIYSDEFMEKDDKPLAPTSLEYFTIGTTLCLTSQTTLVRAMMDIEYTDYRVEHLFEYKKRNLNSLGAITNLDNIQTYVFIKSNESQKTLKTFFNKSLALCFAGDGLANKTKMDINIYLNGNELN